MKKVIGVLVIGGALFALRIVLQSPTSLRAEPLAQATAAPTTRQTDEPTKPPYVFPTPVFIPTFPPDTPSPTATRALTNTPIPPPAGGTIYTIESGDTLWTISRKVYGDPTKYRLIQQANNLPDGARLRRGQILVIPPLTPFPTPTPSPLPTATPTPTSVPPPAAAPALTPTRAPVSTSPPIDVGAVAIALVALACVGGLVGAGALVFIAYRRRQQFALPRVRPLTPRAPSPPPLAPPERLK